MSARKNEAMARLKGCLERNDLDAERRGNMAARFLALANRGDWREKVAVADGLFVTPPEIAARMVALAGIKAGDQVLEPSAGTGRILDAITQAEPDAKITAAEDCPRLTRHLYEKYQDVKLRVGDFLGMDFPERFDAVVMNPPFRRGTDVRHIQRARQLLKPGGKLVALCYDGTAQARELRPIAATWEVLPAGSFKCEGTGAGVVLLTLEAEP